MTFKDRLSYEWIKFKKELMTKKGREITKYFIGYIILVIPLVYYWNHFVFKTVMHHLVNYTASKSADPIIGLPVIAFVFMSLWFCIYKVPLWIMGTVASVCKWGKDKPTMPKGWKKK